MYNIEDEYIKKMSKIESHVYLNKNEKRPYVGIVLYINGFNYFVPLSSPKFKHKTMKNRIDFMKIKGGELGTISLNCMIPVKKNTIIDVKANDKKYEYMISMQLTWLRQHEKQIRTNAEKTDYEKRVSERCCNFTKMEKACLEMDK